MTDKIIYDIKRKDSAPSDSNTIFDYEVNYYYISGNNIIDDWVANLLKRFIIKVIKIFRGK